MAATFPFAPRWIGSFQDTGFYYASENPLAEVWAYVGRFGTDSYLKRLKPDNPALPWPEHVAFAKVRFQQAVQFWRAAHTSPLLTAPLPLYYAFLSLMRADMALGPEVIPRTGHGLRLGQGTDLLSCVARLNEGTFTHYLETQGIAWTQGDQITLKDALGSIVEMYGYLRDIEPYGHVQFVDVSGVQRGDVVLEFPEYPRDFAAGWATDFPKLNTVCRQAAAPAVNTLTVDRGASGETYASIAEFLGSHLLNHLTLTGTESRRMWWALRASEVGLRLDRVGYYHVAAFILGSVVRYAPELILSVSASESGLGWLLQRFLDRAGRFYPQLMMSKAWKRQVYF
jgi:hypothetical protein